MRLLAAALLAALLAGPGGDSKLPGVVQKAVAAGDPAAASQLLEDAARTTTDPVALAWIELYAGESRRLAGDAAKARAHFEQVAVTWPGHPAKNPAVLGMAVIDAGPLPTGNNRATLELVAADNVPASLEVDRHLLLLRALQADGAPADALAAQVTKARRAAGNELALLEKVKAAAPPTEGPPALGGPEPVALAALRSAVDDRRWTDAAALAADFQRRFPGSSAAEEVGWLGRRAAAPNDPHKVAVLLPLSGQYAPAGASVKAAVQLSNEAQRSVADLSFLDTQGKAEGCKAALQKAVLEQGAGIVVGPLLKEEGASCAPVAQAMRVPMVLLSSSGEATAAGDFVFHAFPPLDDQVGALVEELYTKRGLGRIAILHPANNYGEAAARAMTTLATAAGAKVVLTTPYDPATNDFRTVAKTVKAKLTSPGVDAVFVPDSYARVALVASALAFEDVPVGRFRAGGVNPVVLCGLGGWNNDDLARRGGTYVLDSIFVDAFYPRAADPGTGRFMDAWSAHQSGPPSLVEAVAWDTMALVDAALGTGGARPLDLLKGATLASSATGASGFDTRRELSRSMKLLTVTRDGIAPLDAALGAPESPTP